MRLQGAVIGRPWRVLAATGILVVAAAALGTGVQFRTSRSDLAPKDDPDEMRLARISREFRGASDAVVCVEAAAGAEKSPEDLGSFADELARRLRSDPEVAQVYYKVDADWLSEHALYLVPPAAIEEAVEAFRAEGSGLASVHGLASLNEALAARIEAGLGAAPAGPAEDDPEGAARLADLLRWEKRFLENPEPFLTWLESGPPLLRLAGDRPELAHGGYLATRDGATLFLLVSPRSERDDLPTLRSFIGSLRRIAAGAVAERPGFR